MAEKREHGKARDESPPDRRWPRRRGPISPSSSCSRTRSTPRRSRRSAAAGGPTVNWFTDDHWRFDRFTRHFAPAFDWSVTTDRDSLPKYQADRLRAGDPLPVGLQPVRLRQDRGRARSTTSPSSASHTASGRRRSSGCAPRGSTFAAGASAGPRAGSSTTRWSACSGRAGSTSTSRRRSRRRGASARGSRTWSGARRTSRARARSRAVPSRSRVAEGSCSPTGCPTWRIT